MLVLQLMDVLKTSLHATAVVSVSLATGAVTPRWTAMMARMKKTVSVSKGWHFIFYIHTHTRVYIYIYVLNYIYIYTRTYSRSHKTHVYVQASTHNTVVYYLSSSKCM